MVHGSNITCKSKRAKAGLDLRFALIITARLIIKPLITARVGRRTAQTDCLELNRAQREHIFACLPNKHDLWVAHLTARGAFPRKKASERWKSHFSKERRKLFFSVWSLARFRANKRRDTTRESTFSPWARNFHQLQSSRLRRKTFLAERHQRRVKFLNAINSAFDFAHEWGAETSTSRTKFFTFENVHNHRRWLGLGWNARVVAGVVLRGVLYRKLAVMEVCVGGDGVLGDFQFKHHFSSCVLPASDETFMPRSRS